ncbi:J domain-containing protein [Coleofasciculus sp. FACHB-1120]|uniref:J domain-containing protein n=1 Tax=Coleofasciculus sp. FACHB-1120 TaxID=2692783 RepID=UPI001689F17D|nr:J domain-containing protein [Coleofasciculus sp. FACHB-1120]MBD2742679.1 J domain-containing protein [Coleofasciculus sp. FACHB-1120]
MSFRIDRGLFKFDFTDHHAILGVPVDAGVNDIRKRYLKIARRLHPDSCKAENEAEKQRASQMLSKLVNPAYEQLSQDRTRAEYVVMVGRMGKRLAGEAANVQPQGETAKQLAQSGGDLDHSYKTALQKLAQTQYESLSQVLEVTAQISELNMVYLRRKGGSGVATPMMSDKRPIEDRTPPPPKDGPPPPPPPSSVAEPYFRRADELIAKNQFAKAEIELREALKMEPNNSRCHSLLGMVYLKQTPPKVTMAKVHITQALKLNPQDPIGLEGKQTLDKLTQKVAGGKTTTPPKPGQGKPAQGKPEDKSGGGLFGMFGKKK